MPSRHEPLRAVVLGLGPAGRIAAHRAAARGWDVLALDPAGGTIPSTIGAWAHQIPAWAPPELVAARFHPRVITASGARVLDDEYVVLDTTVLASLGGFTVVEERGLGSSWTRYTSGSPHPRWWDIRFWFRADPLSGPGAVVWDDWYDEPDDVPRPDGYGDPNEPGSWFEPWSRPDVVIDTTIQAHLRARQLAVGDIVAEEDVPTRHRVPVLMDFRPPEADVAGMPATFSYRLPLGDGRWLIEETVLATRVAGPADRARLLAGLRTLQDARLAGLGIDGAAVVGTETVDFPLGPLGLPDNRPSTPLAGLLKQTWLDLPFVPEAVPGYGHFGAAGGWMHPATGYSVGAVLADVDRVLDRLAARGDSSPAGGRMLAHLRRRGLRVLLAFTPGQTRTFFDAFFRLPAPAIRAYLTGTSVPATLSVMAALAVPLGRRSPRALLTLVGAFFQRFR